MRKDILAIDFDGTLFENMFPDIGEPIEDMIEYCKLMRKEGSKLILWTCRVGERLNEAVEKCKEYGLLFDAVNENLPETIEYFGTDTRKIFADVYIDDKNCTWFKCRNLELKEDKLNDC